MDKGEAGANEMSNGGERRTEQREHTNLSREREQRQFWQRAGREIRTDKSEAARQRSIDKAKWFLKRDKKEMKAVFDKSKKGNG